MTQELRYGVQLNAQEEEMSLLKTEPTPAAVCPRLPSIRFTLLPHPLADVVAVN